VGGRRGSACAGMDEEEDYATFAALASLDKYAFENVSGDVSSTGDEGRDDADFRRGPGGPPGGAQDVHREKGHCQRESGDNPRGDAGEYFYKEAVTTSSCSRYVNSVGTSYTEAHGRAS
jgi:hypothetical protein